MSSGGAGVFWGVDGKKVYSVAACSLMVGQLQSPSRLVRSWNQNDWAASAASALALASNEALTSGSI
ncbi:hypothetical protein OUZ56_021928 [Daphnia magna]|uniref:Uncharacterized protein n=1 Tax=Daphnia magna TaxID=35525 RepID=A0ABR0AUV5_9CRUS|nr:hypothetical protein OUZ56_021928 [Daphnia magna]